MEFEKLKKIDIFIGEILNILQNISYELSKSNDKDLVEASKHMAYFIPEIWNERGKLYNKFPNLKTDILHEFKQDKLRFELLYDINKKAFEYENKQEFKKAYSSYKKLFKMSQFGYFKLLAEAGMFRTHNVN